MTSLHLRTVQPDDWPALAEGFADLTFEQTRAYAEAAAARVGAEVRFVALETAGEPVAAAALRIRRVPGLGRGIAWCPSGPLVHRADDAPPDALRMVAVLMALRQQIAETEGHVLRCRLAGIASGQPDLPVLAARAGFLATARAPAYRSSAIDLTRTPDALLTALDGKWRTDLRAALKAGLTLDHGTGDDIEARFLAMFETVQAAKGFRPDIGPAFHFRLRADDYPVETLIARHDGADVAGIVVGTAGRCATYLFGATLPAGRPVRAGYFLTWEAIRLAQARGLSWYDLGGIDAVANPDVARFKERMNGQAIMAEPFEARPPGPLASAILGLEALRARLKRGRRS